MIIINGLSLSEKSTFPGGEEHIRIPDLGTPESILIDAKIRGSGDLMQLFLAADAVFTSYPYRDVILKVLYFPYARQDRACRPGESYSLSVVANMIASLPFKRVIIADPHSPKVIQLLEARNVSVQTVTTVDVFGNRPQPVLPNLLLVAPDKGAEKRVAELADFLLVPYIVFSKVRAESGNITNMEYVSASTKLDGPYNALVIDDICDGGGTFLALAALLKPYGFLSVNLYVTHGIFSQGLEPLFTAGYSKIYTTNSFCDLAPIKDKFYVWNV